MVSCGDFMVTGLKQRFAYHFVQLGFALVARSIAKRTPASVEPPAVLSFLNFAELDPKIVVLSSDPLQIPLLEYPNWF